MILAASCSGLKQAKRRRLPGSAGGWRKTRGAPPPSRAGQCLGWALTSVPVNLGRAFLRDPYWALHAAKALGVETAWPDQYLRAKR